MTNHPNKLLITAWNAAVEAAAAIMQVYKGNYHIDYKNDHSPVTVADKLADEIIQHHLHTTGIPVISEESALLPYEQRKDMDELWIVDPLDGTKEFIRHSTDFTVNIGLIKNNTPILGVIIAPALNIGYWGAQNVGAFKTISIQKILNWNELVDKSSSIQCAKFNEEKLRITGTKSHLNKATEEFYKKINQLYSNVEIVSVGSSLKFCMVASGHADLYIRFSSIFEWDTAAGDAIVKAAGGISLTIPDKTTLSYNKSVLIQPNFFVISNDAINILSKLF